LTGELTVRAGYTVNQSNPTNKRARVHLFLWLRREKGGPHLMQGTDAGKLRTISLRPPNVDYHGSNLSPVLSAMFSSATANL
jgi:hypothetical protein